MTEALPVKLSNRGSMQAIGLVTDVGYFLERLESESHHGRLSHCAAAAPASARARALDMAQVRGRVPGNRAR
jgi:hypothetical protein